MVGSAQEKLSFTELAKLAMQMVNRPVTPSELWDFVVQNNLQHRLVVFDDVSGKFSGKTPKASFMRNIYINMHIFEQIPNSKPKQYFLKENRDNLIKDNIGQENIDDIIIYKPNSKKSNFHERALHPILSYFLKNNEYFKAYSKTIFHEESFKGVRGEDKWLYPDMVAVNFEYENYRKNNVLNFIRKFDKPPIKIYSFEIKKELNFSNYKESFFQAVSNSSWANEGYLVTIEIKQDKL